MRDGGNDADFANAIFESIAPGSLAVGMGDFNQRSILRHAHQDLIQGDHGFWRPDTVFFKRHEFDKADNDSFFTREHAERNDLIFVEAAHQNTIDFYRP